MDQFSNTMEIFKLLNKSNCRDCGSATCLAFAAAVFQGRKQIDMCTHLDKAALEALGGKTGGRTVAERDGEAALTELKLRIETIDLPAAAERLGGRYENGRFTLKILGKDFSVDGRGNLYSDIHIHAWVAAPFLNHIITGKGTPVSGNWVPLRELEGGKSWYRLFGQRCEKPLKQVADTYTDLFEDMIRLFSGREVEKHYASDISLVLHPLPLVPILICYWKPEEGMDSSLNIFFDDTAEENLEIESIYALAAGLVRMFEKLALRHGIR